MIPYDLPLKLVVVLYLHDLVAVTEYPVAVGYFRLIFTGGIEPLLQHLI